MLPANKYPKGDEQPVSEEFKSTQFDCQCFLPTCQETLIHPDLVAGLDALALVFPLITIHSAYRCPEHNKKVGGAAHGLHLTGQAADISTPFATIKELRNAAEKIPCFAEGGIAEYRGHVHVDTRGKKARWEDKKKS